MGTLNFLLLALFLVPACSPQGNALPVDGLATVEIPPLAVEARGFPALRNLDGQTLADGDFARWIADERLHMRIRYDFGSRRIDEQAVFRLEAQQLIQDEWLWEETRGGRPFRRFKIDFRSGIAAGEKHVNGGLERWEEEIEIEPGRTFAGFGFTVALKMLRDRLVRGETVELEAVAFTPSPRVVTVEVSHGGVEQMRMADRLLRGDRFDIQAQFPPLVGIFVDVPETRIWLTHPPPAEFLRWEGPLVEPDDPVVRVDLLPGQESGPAEPVKEESRR